MVRRAATHAYFRTDCQSEEKRHGEPFHLPPEVQTRIIEHAIQSTRETMDGSALCALLHTSTWTRCQVARAFEPIRLQKLDVPPVSSNAKRKVELRTDTELAKYIESSLKYWFTDFSLKNYGGDDAPVISNSQHQVATLVKGTPGQRVWCEVYLELDPMYMFDGKSLPKDDMRVTRPKHDETRGRRYNELDEDYKEGEFATVAVACKKLKQALEAMWDMRYQTHSWNGKEFEWNHPSAPFVRFASLYQRAWNGTLDAPTSGARITCIFWLHWLGASADTEVSGERRWVLKRSRLLRETSFLRIHTHRVRPLL